MRPESYRVPNGCHNCRHVLILSDYDDPPEYYCHIDNSPRPRSGACAMSEMFPIYSKDEDKIHSYHHRWNEWASDHRVDWAGTCGEWEDK